MNKKTVFVLVEGLSDKLAYRGCSTVTFMDIISIFMSKAGI